MKKNKMLYRIVAAVLACAVVRWRSSRIRAAVAAMHLWQKAL